VVSSGPSSEIEVRNNYNGIVSRDWAKLWIGLIGDKKKSIVFPENISFFNKTAFSYSLAVSSRFFLTFDHNVLYKSEKNISAP
jgi:hypothetical protein